VAYAELFKDEKGEDIILVETTWNEKELIKLVPGAKWNATERIWSLPPGWAQCVILRGVFKGQVTFGERLTAWGWNEVNNRIKPATSLRLLTERPESAEMATFLRSHSGYDLYDFQAVGAEFILSAGSCLLADEMGTGKTIQALSALRAIGEKDGLPALVICPNSVKTHWVNEAREWFPECEPIMIDGSAAVKTKQLEHVLAVPNALVIINIEALRLHSRVAGFGSIRLARCQECDRYGDPYLKPARCETHAKGLNHIPFKTVIVDEAHRIKDPHSKQTRAAWALMHGPTVERNWALTGTPIANDPSDLWSIMHGVIKSEYPTKSKYVDRFCLMAWNAYGGLDITGLNPEHKDEFYKILDPRLRAMPKALVLSQLPPKVREYRHVMMTPKQAKAYKDMEQALITRLDDGEILVAQNNLAAQTRLLQLSSSYCTITPDPTQSLGSKVMLCEPSPKLDALDEIIEEMAGKKLTVCAQSRQLILMAAKRAEKKKIPHGLIIGGMSQWERDLALRDFQTGDSQILFFTVQAGGTGLTMTAADTQVFLQRSWSMVDNKQAEDRVHRIGSERHESVTIIDIITRGTVEERQLLRLYDKMKRLDEITRLKATLVSAGKPTAHLDEEEALILSSYLG